MTRDEVIALAQEAKMFYQPQAGWIAELHHLERFAALVAAHEREACAKVCDDWPNGRDDVDSIADAIRNRSN